MARYGSKVFMLCCVIGLTTAFPASNQTQSEDSTTLAPNVTSPESERVKESVKKVKTIDIAKSDILPVGKSAVPDRIYNTDGLIVFIDDDNNDAIISYSAKPNQEPEIDNTVIPEAVETTTDFLDNRHVFDLPTNCQPGKKSDKQGICRKIQ